MKPIVPFTKKEKIILEDLFISVLHIEATKLYPKILKVMVFYGPNYTVENLKLGKKFFKS